MQLRSKLYCSQCMGLHSSAGRSTAERENRGHEFYSRWSAENRFFGVGFANALIAITTTTVTSSFQTFPFLNKETVWRCPAKTATRSATNTERQPSPLFFINCKWRPIWKSILSATLFSLYSVYHELQSGQKLKPTLFWGFKYLRPSSDWCPGKGTSVNIAFCWSPSTNLGTVPEHRL